MILTIEDEIKLMLYDAKEQGDMFKLQFDFKGCSNCKSKIVNHLLKMPYITESKKAEYYLVCNECDTVIITFWKMEEELYNKTPIYREKWGSPFEHQTQKKMFLVYHKEKAKDFMEELFK